MILEENEKIEMSRNNFQKLIDENELFLEPFQQEVIRKVFIAEFPFFEWLVKW